MKNPLEVMICLLLLIPFASVAMAQSTSAPNCPEAVLDRARQLIAGAEQDRSGLQEAVDLLEKAALDYPGDYRVPLALAEAWYRMADPEAKIETTWPFYEKTEEYCEKALDLEPGRPETRYWYGLSQLKRAQKKGGVRAYFAARKGIGELEEVLKQMPRYDHAGAARVLTLLYTVAPGWSPFGDLDKAIDYGRQAVRFDPDYPLNRLYLAQAYEKAGRPEAAAEQYKKILEEGGGKFSEEARRRLKEVTRDQ